MLGERWCSSVLVIRVSMVASLGSNNFCQTKCENSENRLLVTLLALSFILRSLLDRLLRYSRNVTMVAYSRDKGCVAIISVKVTRRN